MKESIIPQRWLLLHYKLPPRPTALRVYIWRKLRRLGAILWQDAVWVLPDGPRTREQFQWVSTEIVERGGEASFWAAQFALPGQELALIEQFNNQVKLAYRAVLAGLKKKNPDLAALSRQFQQAQAEDYFDSPLGQQVRAALLSARGGKEL